MQEDPGGSIPSTREAEGSMGRRRGSDQLRRFLLVELQGKHLLGVAPSKWAVTGRDGGEVEGGPGIIQPHRFRRDRREAAGGDGEQLRMRTVELRQKMKRNKDYYARRVGA